MDQQTRNELEKLKDQQRSFEKEILNEVVEVRIKLKVMQARVGVLVALGGIIIPALMTWLVQRATGG